MPKKIKSAPTIFYPESDGKPMAEAENAEARIEQLLAEIDTLKSQNKN